jgi:hypothetical protein
MGLVKKVRKQITISDTASECAEKKRKTQNRSFNNYIETLILKDCNEK